MKRNACLGRFLCVFLTVLLLCAFPLSTFASENVATVAADTRCAPYLYSVDFVSDGKGFSSSTIYIYENFTLSEDGVLTLKGWFATDEGIDRYEYAWVAGLDRTPQWKTAHNISIVERPDLAAAGIPYTAGHSSAGFSFDIIPPEGLEDGYYDVYVRAITGDGVACDMVLFSHMMYGTPDFDDGEMRSISFPRLAKSLGALKEASVSEAGLVMTNLSMVALGSLDLGAFDRIRIAYTVSQSYAEGKQAMIGFKSASEHLYGNGEGRYDLTNHVTALPLNTNVTEPQTVELDLNKVDLVPHEGLYLAAYIKDGVTLTVHNIELIYRGRGFDRTAAKIYFSEDLIGRFSGRNQVDLKGVQDPVMGDVLRIEVIDHTNDPFAHFNASGVLGEYGLRLTANDYKYMVVLARASHHNLHGSMTFYLCAGSILGATEACTYTHQLIKDGQWHYYVFDLTNKENWKGNINGWRFDIINGDCDPGNFVDFASVQFFRTPEAAAEAARASVTQNVTPYAKEMPAVVCDDTEDSVISDLPMIFEDGDWFEETTVPETEPATLPENTKPLEPAETLPSEDTADTAAETQAQTVGCASSVTVSALAFIVPLVFIIKKKIRRI